MGTGTSLEEKPEPGAKGKMKKTNWKRPYTGGDREKNLVSLVPKEKGHGGKRKDQGRIQNLS